MVRDVRIGTSASDGTSLQCDASDANAALGAMLMSADGICWQHAHANEYNVYESSWWTLAQVGKKVSGLLPPPPREYPMSDRVACSSLESNREAVELMTPFAVFSSDAKTISPASWISGT